MMAVKVAVGMERRGQLERDLGADIVKLPCLTD